MPLLRFEDGREYDVVLQPAPPAGEGFARNWYQPGMRFIYRPFMIGEGLLQAPSGFGIRIKNEQGFLAENLCFPVAR